MHYRTHTAIASRRVPLLTAIAASSIVAALSLAGCSAAAPAPRHTHSAPKTATAATSLQSQLPTLNEIRATLGPTATIAQQPTTKTQNPNPKPSGNACEAAYETVLAEPWQENAVEAATTDGGALREEWHLWRFSTTAAATKTMSDVDAVGENCVLENGNGVEGYKVAVSYAAGFETAQSASDSSATPTRVVWIFVRSGATVAIGIVNTDDKTILSQVVGVELGTLKS